MQYFEEFDDYWEAIIQEFLHMAMAGSITLAILQARFVQQTVHSQVLNERGTLSNFSVFDTIRGSIFFINKTYPNPSFVTDSLFVEFSHLLSLYRCYVIWGFQKKIVIVPALLMLSTFIMGIAAAVPAIFSIADMQIIASLAAAANVVVTALTGKLESGAIYCITAIFIVITLALDEAEIYNAGSGIAQQLNIIPTFTLAFVGLKNTDYSQPKEHIHQVPSNHHTSSRSVAVTPSQPCEVLDIKLQATEEKYGECV
ncbi:hypothetical protein B0H13DRAFT_2538660 [Mycena leptocephala]|nr:hypothetical protein B0H13DRAFT_2538660 [Mycena leptocephala]